MSVELKKIEKVRISMLYILYSFNLYYSKVHPMFLASKSLILYKKFKILNFIKFEFWNKNELIDQDSD